MCSLSYAILRIDVFFPLAAPPGAFCSYRKSKFPVNRDFFGLAVFFPVNRDFLVKDAGLEPSRTLLLAASQ